MGASDKRLRSVRYLVRSSTRVSYLFLSVPSIPSFRSGAVASEVGGRRRERAGGGWDAGMLGGWQAGRLAVTPFLELVGGEYIWSMLAETYAL